MQILKERDLCLQACYSCKWWWEVEDSLKWADNLKKQKWRSDKQTERNGNLINQRKRKIQYPEDEIKQLEIQSKIRIGMIDKLNRKIEEKILSYIVYKVKRKSMNMRNAQNAMF